MALRKPRTRAEICLAANAWKLWPGKVLGWRAFSPQSPIFAEARRSTTIALLSNWLSPAAKVRLVGDGHSSTAIGILKAARPGESQPWTTFYPPRDTASPERNQHTSDCVLRKVSARDRSLREKSLSTAREGLSASDL